MCFHPWECRQDGETPDLKITANSIGSRITRIRGKDICVIREIREQFCECFHRRLCSQCMGGWPGDVAQIHFGTLVAGFARGAARKPPDNTPRPRTAAGACSAGFDRCWRGPTAYFCIVMSVTGIMIMPNSRPVGWQAQWTSSSAILVGSLRDWRATLVP